jgi:four helix bundle protein
MLIKSHRDLEVYKRSLDLSMAIWELTKKFPAEERYALTDQMRRSSRSVGANITEAWRKRRYEASFVHRINDAEAEAAETQHWIEVAKLCKHIPAASADELDAEYERLIASLVTMIRQSHKWTLKPRPAG